MSHGEPSTLAPSGALPTHPQSVLPRAGLRTLGLPELCPFPTRAPPISLPATGSERHARSRGPTYSRRSVQPPSLHYCTISQSRSFLGGAISAGSKPLHIRCFLQPL